MKRLLLPSLIAAHTAALSIHSQAAIEAPELEELLVLGTRDSRTIQLAETVEITPDAAQLLRKAPGANVNGNGPLSGIPQYRGMYGDRIKVTVNGNTLSSGGPNWMDPPLSYAPAAQLESLTVTRGIAPVSAGQETIGGAIEAKTWSGEFGSSSDFSVDARLRAGGQSVNSGSLASAAVVLANDSHKIKLSAMDERGDDAEFDGGSSDSRIEPTEYERQRYDIGYGVRFGNHTLQFDLGHNRTGDTGTPALPMDIDYIDSDLASAHYNYDNGNIKADVKLYGSDIEHGMTNYHLRQAPMADSMYRQNIAEGENRGFDFDFTMGNWTFGLDGHREIHDSNIDNINNPNFFVVNFNDAERELLGAFVEHKFEFDNGIETELGLRANRVTMDADEVDGTPANMSMSMNNMAMGSMNMGMNSMAMNSMAMNMMAMVPPGQALRDDFNNADRSHTDNNIDWVAKAYYPLSDATTLYSGLARKTRSASYQERYLWLPMQATGGLADGRTYTGNLELDAEVAHEIELGFDVDQGALKLSPRVFYRDVKDYIQGTASNSDTAVAFVDMMNNMNGTAPASGSDNQSADPLQFNNVDAKLYGFDMDWGYRLASSWSVSGVINYVRGERTDVNDDLYRIAPLNGSLAVNYFANDWALTVEGVAYDQQSNVSDYNSEQDGSGYGLLNLRGHWQFTSSARLGFGVDNALDRKYRDHLAGTNRVMGNSDIAQDEKLPGYGRNAYARIDFSF